MTRGFGVGLLCAWSRFLWAHDSPEHTLTALSAQMAASGRTAPLLCQRAVEYRAFGKPDLAVADFEAALAAADRALALVPEEKLRGGLHLLRAEVRVALHDDRGALADCDRAFRAAAASLDAYLLRAQVQSRLGRLADAAQGLKAGFDQLGSAVLKAEWIEILIDAGRAREALPEIDTELKEARWRSAWLLRRARALKSLGQDATRELDAALAELSTRLLPGQPDLFLLADRGLVLALRGDFDGARCDFEAARAAGAEPWLLQRLGRLLKENAGPHQLETELPD